MKYAVVIEKGENGEPIPNPASSIEFIEVAAYKRMQRTQQSWAA
jgi:hypothetical protein